MLLDSLEKQYASQGLVCGVDEVGRGPWAGPVVAAAVVLQLENLDPQQLSKIKDSKKLTASQREEISQWLQSQKPHVTYALGEASVEEIENTHILKASLLAMKRAVEGLSAFLPPSSLKTALIDGPHTPSLTCQAIPLIKGDSLSISIGAASILAKVYRDSFMRKLAQEYPGYGWETNAGYGTKIHQQALATLGVTPHHRRTFKPIQALMGQAS